MKAQAGIWAALLIVIVCGVAPSNAQPVQTRSVFVRLGNGVPALLYEPTTAGPKSAIAIFLMHAEGDYLQFVGCSELSKRGYRVLCANNSASKSGPSSDFSIDRILLDAELGVAYLRKYPGVRKVVLLGHSGGGALMASYQNIAENGLKACQGPEKILKCPDTLAGMPAADGLILLDSNFGLAGMTLLSTDPAIVDEDSGQKTDPELDLFNPKNGFDPSGSHYSEAFIHKFQMAVGQRQNRLIRTATDRLALIEAGKGRFSDDEPLTIPGASYLGFNNKLFAQDTRLLSHTQRPLPLLRKDGTLVTQIVHTVRVAENTASGTASLDRGALKTTVRRFLGSFAVRVDDTFGYGEDAIRGVDWASSYNCPGSTVQTISAPLLTLGMTGHWEFLAAELIYDNAKSADKTVVFVEGASHGITPCTKCEKYPGEFGDTVKTTFDYVDSWLSKPGRFQGSGATLMPHG